MLTIKKIISAIIISSIFLFLIPACSELDQHSTVNRFKASEDLYQSGMRWGEWPRVLYLIRAQPDESTLETMMVKVNPENGKEYQEVIPKNNNSLDITEQRRQAEERLAYLETIKVTHTEALSSSMSEADGTGETRFQIDYHFDNSSKVNSIRHTVIWWFDEPSNNWFTETPLPKEFEKPEEKHKTIKLSPKRY